MTRSLVIGSRGSKLALWQAEHTRNSLLQANPQLSVQIQIIKTTGDTKTDPLSAIGGKGVFTKELEDALLDHRIDIAVHSLKDLPTVLPNGLAISAFGEREDPRDALVLRHQVATPCTCLSDLPDGAVVGTSSPRRLAQLKFLRPDVVVKDLRGNVDTRIRKLDEGQYDALILASAGLLRLGLRDRISAFIPTAEMLPAVGQGAIGIETRAEDELAVESISKLNHVPTECACMAERSLLRSLGGGCQLPIAAHAVVDEITLRLEGLVAAGDGSQLLRAQSSSNLDNPEALGVEVSTKLVDLGANFLLA